jgi:hypothetical protein
MVKLSKAWQPESKPWKTSPGMETWRKESRVRRGKLMGGAFSSGKSQLLTLRARRVEAERSADSGSGCPIFPVGAEPWCS